MIKVNSASLPAVLSMAFGLILASMPAVSGRPSQSRVAPKKAADQEKAGNVVHMTVEQLLQYYPDDLRGAKFSTNQDELDSLLEKVGERVEGFFLNYPNTTSKESVLLERLKGNGKSEESLSQIFDYMIRVRPDLAGLGFEEDRSDNLVPQIKHNKLSEYCLTSGYTGTLILFHPRRQSESIYRYLGRQSTEPHAHIVAFAQKPEIRDAIGAFRTGASPKSTPLLYQGLLWVDPRTYQILRMRTDLLAPMPEISLAGHTTELSFSEVHFNSISQAFWLPQKVVVTIRWKGKIYRNLHRYSDYKLFTVKTIEKVEQPQVRKQ